MTIMFASLCVCVCVRVCVGIDSQYFDVFEKPSGVVVVDLDANSILM